MIEEKAQRRPTLPHSFCLRRNMALFLDFDGTLAPFADDPETVRLTKAQEDILLKCSEVLEGALALISGRDIRDLSKRVPKTLWRIGNHGLYRVAPNEDITHIDESFPDDLAADIKQITQLMPDVWCERKGPVMAVHYRAAQYLGKTLCEMIAKTVQDYPAYISQQGNNVIDVKPVCANKGMALTEFMDRAPFTGRMPIMIGDDTTDEDGFIAAQKLGGMGLHVGGGDTSAAYRLNNIDHVYSLLGSLL